MKNQVKMTGVLRGDIRLLHGDTPLLFDPASDTYYKVSERMAGIISFFSDDMTPEAMVEKLYQNGIIVTPEELNDICLFLQGNGLLIPRYGETAKRLEQQDNLKKKTFLLRLSSLYFFIKLPPWRPERFFTKISPFVSFLTSRPFIILWMLPAIFGYLLAIRSYGQIAEQFLNTLSWIGLAKYVLSIIFVKIIHESAHSLAAMHFRCRVRGIGLGFIFFVPRLYTDTTDSWRLPRKQRLLIDGAGIIAELICGGIAVFLWSILPQGSWKATMFYIFAVSTISTLLVNGNVFIRYDGYYILSDLLGIENLMTRSAECVKRTWRYYFLRLGAPSEEKHKFLLLCYGISAFIYRIFLYTSICLLIYYKFIKVIAVLMLALEIYTLLIYPLAAEIRTIWQLSRKTAGKAIWVMLIFTLTFIAGILFIPLSWGVHLPGETAPAQRIPVSVIESGYLKHPLAARSVEVDSGTVIAELSAPLLNISEEKVKRTAEYDKTLYSLQELDAKEFVRTGVTAEKIRSDNLALQELQRRQGNLIIKAERAGRFVPSLRELSAGAFLKKNTQIGEIVSRKNTVYAYASDEQIGKIYINQKGVVIFSDVLKEIPCRVKNIDPVAVQLKNSPILQIYGGPVPAYQIDHDEYVASQTLYKIELEVQDEKIISGRLVNVKLSHTERLYTHISKMLLSFFRKEF